MTEEQKELLKAMHTIQDYCNNRKNCTDCPFQFFSGRCYFSQSKGGCPCEWFLKPIEEKEPPYWTVFNFADEDEDEDDK